MKKPLLEQVVQVYQRRANCWAKPVTIRCNVYSIRKLCTALDCDLDGLDRQRIQEWLVGQKNPITANSVVRKARSLFGREATRDQIYRDLELPPLDGLMGCRLIRVSVEPWVAPTRGEIEKLFAGAPILREVDTRAYKAFLLSSVAGLRAAESGNLQWNHIVEEMGQLKVHVMGRKTMRGRMIPIPRVLMKDLEELKDDPTWVIGGSKTERTDQVWRRLSAWFRARGWKRQLKAHELRKLLGAQLATSTGGLYVPQAVLGHSNPKTTSMYYASLLSSDYSVLYPGEGVTQVASG